MTVLSAGASVIRYSASNIGNGWYKFTVTWTSISTSEPTVLYNMVGLPLNIGVYGAQLELGRFSTSYIPTTTAAVTREADTLTMPTGTWYHSSMGTIATQASLPYLGGNTYPRIAALSDDTTNNRITLLIADAEADQILAQIHAATNQSLGASFSVYVPNTPIKLGVSYKPNDAIAASSGVLSSANTSAVIPSMNIFGVGTFSPSTPRHLNGNIQKIKYYPTRVTNTQLQLLTQ